MRIVFLAPASEAAANEGPSSAGPGRGLNWVVPRAVSGLVVSTVLECPPAVFRSHNSLSAMSYASVFTNVENSGASDFSLMGIWRGPDRTQNSTRLWLSRGD